MTQRRGSTTELDASHHWQLVVTGALAIVSCDPRQASSQALTHRYQPTTVGDEWVYRISQSHPAVQLPTTESVERIVAVEQRGDRLVARVHAEFFGSRSERDLVIGPLGVTPEIGDMTSSVGDVNAQVVEGVYLPRELSPGMRWDFRQQLNTPISKMSVSGTCQVVGDGEFQGMGAVHVRCETKNHVVTTMQGAPPQTIEHVQIEDNYYVRGLGLVRSVTTTPQGYRSEKVLVRWNVAGAPGGPATGKDPQAPAASK
ncbi:MAG TPA: hypothetical protein VIK91_27260 [Nannocystis sp.]